MNVIEINHLTKSYGKARGIENINFEVKEGEIFGFIGPNGAGKSTTIRTLLNFLYPTSGSAKILGLDIVKDSKEIRKQVGYLPSEVHYYDDMKVEELFRFSAHVLQEHITDTSYEFIFNGHTRDLLEQLRSVPFDDVTIAEPTLEEVFMHYYESKAGDRNGLKKRMDESSKSALDMDSSYRWDVFFNHEHLSAIC